MPLELTEKDALLLYGCYVDGTQGALHAFLHHMMKVKGLPPEALQRITEYLRWQDALLSALASGLDESLPDNPTHITRH